MSISVHCIAEEGLAKAKEITAALYKGDFAAIASLSKEELISIFTGAKLLNLMYRPGLTAMELALEAKCFKHERTSN